MCENQGVPEARRRRIAQNKVKPRTNDTPRDAFGRFIPRRFRIDPIDDTTRIKAEYLAARVEAGTMSMNEARRALDLPIKPSDEMPDNGAFEIDFDAVTQQRVARDTATGQLYSIGDGRRAKKMALRADQVTVKPLTPFKFVPEIGESAFPRDFWFRTSREATLTPEPEPTESETANFRKIKLNRGK